MDKEKKEAFKSTLDRLLWKIQGLEATIKDFNGDQRLLEERL